MKYKWTKNLSIASPMILISSVIIAGGGHGFTNQLIILFPWAYLTEPLLSSTIFFLVGLIQFPIYGFLYDISKDKNLRFGLIAITHLFLVTAIFLLYHNGA